MAEVKIHDIPVGDGHPCFVIGEIGINHNGDIDLAKRLIDMAEAAGCNAVKFQKRTVEVVYSSEELAKPRESPFGTINGDLKRALELAEEEYRLTAAATSRESSGLPPAGTSSQWISSANSTFPATRLLRPV
jgi:sialic acid synthase SpsE